MAKVGNRRRFYDSGHRGSQGGLRPVREPNDAARLSVAGSNALPLDQAYLAGAFVERSGRSH